MRRGETWGGGGGGGCHINANVCISIFLIEHLVHKLLTIVSRFPILLEMSVLKTLYLVFG